MLSGDLRQLFTFLDHSLGIHRDYFRRYGLDGEQISFSTSARIEIALLLGSRDGLVVCRRSARLRRPADVFETRCVEEKLHVVDSSA